MRILKVGDIVKSTRSVLGNEKGSEGVVYEIYDIGDGPGASIIFENGEYDGFSPIEQSTMLQRTGHEASLAGYMFTNVMQLSRDYEKGLFDLVFQ